MNDHRISSEIKRRVPRRKIFSRINLLEELFQRICDKANILELKDCSIDKATLLAVVKSYFYDIERLKLFHDIDRINNAKIAAYTVKWICKLKPIQLNPKVKGTKPTLVANELFAILVAFDIIKTPMSLVSDQIFEKLLYNLVYRPYEEGSMALLFEFWIDANSRYSEVIRMIEENQD